MKKLNILSRQQTSKDILSLTIHEATAPWDILSRTVTRITQIFISKGIHLTSKGRIIPLGLSDGVFLARCGSCYVSYRQREPSQQHKQNDDVDDVRILSSRQLRNIYWILNICWQLVYALFTILHKVNKLRYLSFLAIIMCRLSASHVFDTTV